MAPTPQVPSLRIRSLDRRSTGRPVPTQTTIEYKHTSFYTSMDPSVSSSNAPSENSPSMLDSTFSQTAPGASVCIHVLFSDSSTLLTCVFHQTRRTLCLRTQPDSIYATPAKAKTWNEHPLQASSHSAPPWPMPTATHGGIGCTLSLNASSLPFKVMLTLLNLCVMLRDSRDAKTDMQPESLKSFVRQVGARAGA